jgi:hypothetical protein
MVVFKENYASMTMIQKKRFMDGGKLDDKLEVSSYELL